LQYFNAGALTNDAGQAAGVAVVAQLAYRGIKNSLGSAEGSFADSSLTFTGTALTTEVNFDWKNLEQVDYATLEERVNFIVKDLSNGQYVVDYANGVIVGRKASTAPTLTGCSYKLNKLEVDATVTVPPITIDNVTVVASALPTGAATEATLSAMNSKVATCDTDDVTVTASALPAGAATSSNQTNGNQKTKVVGNLINVEYDNMTHNWNAGTFTDTFVYKLVAATVATVTIVYTDATKSNMVSLNRT
jgi:hypothetical protein